MLVFSLVILMVTGALLVLTIWNAVSWPRVGKAAPSPASPTLSVLVPARDEEHNIRGCLESILQQDQSVSEILIYDDHSIDATAQVVSEFIARDSRVSLLTPLPLPKGWCGKTFACAQLAEHARGEWLLFVDADTRLRENAIGRMLTTAQVRDVTLLSVWPRLETHSFWERALMPLLNFVVFTLYPAPLALRRPLDPSLGLGHGACMLARRDVYESVGGHAAVRDQLFEDVRLAQHWRRRGFHSLCLDGQEVISVRMYRSLMEIWVGFQKNFFPAFRRGYSFFLFLALHLGCFLLPFVLFPLAFPQPAAWIFLTAAACVLLIRAVLAARFKHPWWSLVFHPLAETMLVALGIASWLKFKRGRGVEWKGRRYVAAD